MSSKRHQRRRACEGKVFYAVQAEAVAAAGALRRSRDGGTWKAYRCKFCGGWHVGRPTARERQAMRARREAAAQ